MTKNIFRVKVEKKFKKFKGKKMLVEVKFEKKPVGYCPERLRNDLHRFLGSYAHVEFPEIKEGQPFTVLIRGTERGKVRGVMLGMGFKNHLQSIRNL